MSDDVVVARDGAVLTATFNRPARHNALTFPMYDALHAACESVDADSSIRVLVLRGAGGKAFASGTDIAVFRDFASGADGVAYERRVTEVVNRLEDVRVPTVAVIEGYCLGGGLALAAACDLRVAARSAQFGVPIARTLGNCLSVNTMSLLVARLGAATALDMVLRARVLDAAAAHHSGFVAEVCEPDMLAPTVAAIVETLMGHAPLTIWAAKTAVARLRRAALPDGDDLVTKVFGSDDFRRAVAGFASSASREPIAWTGR